MIEKSKQLESNEVAVVLNGQLKILKTITAIVVLCVLFVSWGTTLGMMYVKVENNTKNSEAALKMSLENENVILLIGRDIEYILKGVGEIKLKLSEIKSMPVTTKK